LAAPAVAEPARPVSVVSEAPYQPAGEQQLIVHSGRLNRNFVVVVSVPPGPLAAASGKLPAIYALDGGYGVAGPIAQMMAWAFMMSPAYVISIGYAEGQADKRDTDLLFRTTVRDGAVIGGGGTAFEAFLTEDLRPYLESRYPLDPAKAVLFGHSYGGLFAANVLADAPASFAAYVIASPSVFADPQTARRVAAVVAKGQGRRVFVAVGGGETTNDMVGGARRLAEILSAPGSTFVTKMHVFAGASHISYYPELVPPAFAWVLPVAAGSPQQERRAISVPMAELDRLTGVYELADGRVITVTRKASMLFAGMTGYPGGQVLAETPLRFFAPGLDVVMTFEARATGRASAVDVRINGATIHAARGGAPGR
jgi:predicted alpha/beta superfamily hydrolase